MTRARRVILGLTVVAALLMGLPAAAAADSPAPGGAFVDDDGSIHEGDIEALVAAGVVHGCNPPSNDLYCASRPVTRGEFASMLARALGLLAGPDAFGDDDGTIHEAAIDAIAAAGITKGCNPPANDRYCPDRPVQRGEMAVMLVRAFALAPGTSDAFADDAGSPYEVAIDAIAAAGITKGCNPPINDRYCPDEAVTRAQMASFLVRALGLDSMPPPPRGAAERTEALLAILERYGFFRPEYGTGPDHVAQAVMAFHKANGLPRTWEWTPHDWVALGSWRGPDLPIGSGEANRIEIDLSRQLLYLVEEGEVEAIVPIASGAAPLYTPTGDFRTYAHIGGWRQSALGWLYKPWYFFRGYAIHGSDSVPPWPASHGCVRVPNWEADYLETRLTIGVPVHIRY